MVGWCLEPQSCFHEQLQVMATFKPRRTAISTHLKPFCFFGQSKLHSIASQFPCAQTRRSRRTVHFDGCNCWCNTALPMFGTCRRVKRLFSVSVHAGQSRSTFSRRVVGVPYESTGTSPSFCCRSGGAGACGSFVAIYTVLQYCTYTVCVQS